MLYLHYSENAAKEHFYYDINSMGEEAVGGTK